MPSANIEKHDFAGLQEDGTVPVRYSLDLDIPPVEAYSIIRDFDDTGYNYLLESAETEQVTSSSEMKDHGRYSFIGFDPAAVVRVGERAEIEALREEENSLGFSETVENGEIKVGYDTLDVLRDVDPEIDLNRLEENDRPFEGGLVGFHPYEMVNDIKPLGLEREQIPDSVFVFSDRYLAYDHVEDELELVFIPDNSIDPEEQYEEIERSAEEVVDKLLTEDPEIDDSISIQDSSAGSEEEYHDMVEDVGRHVENGDIYQGVVSRKKNFDVEGDPLTVYEDVRERNPSPYMYFLDFQEKGVLGASPETLVKTRGREIETNPIAGTVKRGNSPVQDVKLKGDMLSDEKEIAEHTMLVDIGRNDTKRVCKPGSTGVDQLMDVVTYSTVLHIESIVSGTLEEGKDRFDGMRSIFPAGTLTGAPKIRAMEIINEQEDDLRGLYGGAVGYYSTTGDMDSAITIRTMTFDETEEGFSGEVQAGAGIVHDSVPGDEFDETDDKMGSIVESLEAVNGGENDVQ